MKEREQLSKEREQLSLEIEELEERIAPGILANPMAPANAGPAAGPHIPQVAADNWFGAAANRC